MRFLFLAPTVDLSSGTGDATHVREEARCLSQFGTEVFLIVGRSGDIVLLGPKVVVRHSGYRRRFDSSVDLVQYLLHLGWAFVVACRLCRRSPPNVIYERHVFLDIGPLLSRLTNIPSVSELNGLVADERGELDPGTLRQNGVIRWVESSLLRGHRGYVCVTSDLARFAKNVARPRGSDILVAGNGVDVERFTPGQAQPSSLGLPDGRYVVFAGQLVPGQGLRSLLDAMQIVVTREPSARLLVVGGGPDLSNLARLAEAKGLLRNVFFRGPVRHEDVPSYLRVAQVCVAPKNPVRMTSPIKVFEYLAAGKPIVVTDSVELAGIIATEGLGAVVKYGDTNDLASALLKFLQNPILCEETGLRGRHWVQQHQSWEQITARIAEFVQNLGMQH